ncbi:MAG: 2-phospho-L-lactate guanylyltransferase [Acidobacteria bacterium]|nr:2-phospho-L-lactate guanylyltransferase [Acidobacteriota bacterium]
MIFALLPVKAPPQAKQRLNGFLSAAEREALARIMYEDVLAVLCASRGLDRIVVVTSDEATDRHARGSGALVFEEQEQRSHSHSADAAARRATEMGARTILLIPIDVPLVTPAEIEELIAAAAEAGVVIVPSSDGTGTNALARTPPDAIRSRFGPGSFRAHLDQAKSLGRTVKVLRPPGLVFDVDTPDDAAELLARAPHSRAAQVVRSKWALKS